MSEGVAGLANDPDLGPDKEREMTSVQTGVAVATPDLTAIKQRQQATWASGDFGIIGTTLQIVGETLCEAADLRSGSKVLDVAAGNGNCSLAAARRWCDVTSTDYVPALLEDGRRRAAAERLTITFREADVEALPFDDGAFDAVLSSFGVMFAPDHQRSASEMLRVVRSGGTIALANWTPAGFIGRLFGVIGRHVPPPAGVTPPARWGLPEHLELLFGAGAAQIRTTPRDFMFRYLLGGALHRRLPDLVRAGAQGVRGAARQGPGPAGRRHARADRRVQRGRRRHDGGAGRVPGSRRHQALAQPGDRIAPARTAVAGAGERDARAVPRPRRIPVGSRDRARRCASSLGSGVGATGTR